MRKIPLADEEYYHVFNRGVDKRKVFLNKKDYWRFLFSMCLMNDKNNGMMLAWRDFKKNNSQATLEDFFLTSNVRKQKPLVEIIAYCLNPNHYHLILRQIEEKGIEIFMQKLGNGYTKYFNSRNKRSGVLFQGRFKSSHIDTNDYLLYVSAYVNCNSQVHAIAPVKKYFWSSFREYTEGEKDHPILLNKRVILGQFDDGKDYEKFAFQNLAAMREKKEMEKIIDEDF